MTRKLFKVWTFKEANGDEAPSLRVRSHEVVATDAEEAIEKYRAYVDPKMDLQSEFIESVELVSVIDIE